jgi:uncharacterized membrane protein
MLGFVEILTGIGLATSAGLNAYIPLLMIGLLARFTNLMDLPPGWHWLENGWTITILVLLLIVEFVADKIPLVDHANDLIQTFIRPTAGGLAFGAASAPSATVGDPGNFFSSHQWVPIAAGVIISLIVHGMKASARPVINASTAGFGAPVASTAEDIFSTLMSAVAIILPFLIIFFVAGLIGAFVALRRRRRRRKALKAERRAMQAQDGRTLDLWR